MAATVGMTVDFRARQDKSLSTARVAVLDQNPTPPA
jgi:hypothetical protein